MKRLLFFITLLAFSVGSLTYAAPAQSATGGGASNKQVKRTSSKTTKKASSSTKRTTTKKASTKANTPLAQKSKAQTRKEAQQKAFGLMPSELDNMAHNVFHADAAAIKGARDTESALRYLPFVTIINTAGFGNQLDLRGQGRLSSTGIKFQINGIDATPVDSYYGFMPINTILPQLIQEIEVKPGVEARGGTINIITSKRQAPYFLVGGGYTNTVSSSGASYNVFASVNENLGTNVKINAGVAYSQIGGPREDDENTGIHAVLGGEYNLGWGQKIYFDADFFYQKQKTTPYNSFLGYDEYTQIANKILVGGVANAETRYISINPNLNPKDRNKKGIGEIDITQTRALAILGYNNELTKILNLDIKGFYFTDERKFNTYLGYTPYVLVGNVFFVKPITPSGGIWTDGKTESPYGDDPTKNYVTFDQSGSSFKEDKIGIKINVDYKHTGGLLAFGYNGVYENSKRNSKQYIKANLANTEYQLWIDSVLDSKAFVSSFYIKENFSPTNWFSLMAGVQYDSIPRTVKINDKLTLQENTNQAQSLPDTNLKKDRKENLETFVFQVSPVVRYSNTGMIYLRAETGYKATPAYAAFNRILDINLQQGGTAQNAKIEGFEKTRNEPTNLDSETYYTAEIGFKELIGSRMIPLGVTDFDINALLFSANVFYTASKNEFYFTGDPYSGMNLGTYDKSRRMGAEIALEQYFFNGNLGFNESFTYLKAEKFALVNGEEKWDSIPYTYDYKATFGVNFNFSQYIEVIDVSLGVWLQNSLYGNQTVIRKDVTMKRYFNTGVDTIPFLSYETKDVQHKLDPYIISDFGISVGLNKNAAVITVGIKNIFDTFYYDYYNADLSTTTNESRYVIGRGRTVFLEGQYKY